MANRTERQRDPKGRYIKQRSLISTDLGSSFISNMRPASSGVVVNATTALNLAAFWRGVNVLAGDMTRMPLEVFQHLPNCKGKTPRFDHPAYRLLTRPNDYQTGRKLRKAAVVHLILFGNAYVEIIRDQDTGEPVALQLLDPRLIKPKRIDGRLVFAFSGTRSPWSDKSTLLAENVLHFQGLSLNGDLGISGLDACSDSLGLGLAVQEYAGTLFKNMAIPNGVVECPPGWDEEARKNFRESWYQVHGGIAGSNGISILEEGAKYVGTSFNPE